MLYIVLGILLLVAVVIISRWFITAKPSKAARFLKYLFIFLCASIAIFLGVTGKAYFSIIPLALSKVPSIVASTYGGATGQGGRSKSSQYSVSDDNMTREQALEVLGLEEGVSENDINMAHKELLKKNHPDHGGSKYLAAQINRAKEILLEK